MAIAEEISDKLLLQLFRRFPPRPGVTIFREADGRPESEYAAEEAGPPFFSYFCRTSALFEDKDVLDIGSGFGGRTVKYLEYGARSVTGLEIGEDKVESGRAFAEQRGVADRARFELGEGEALPFPSESFDLVTMLDTLEHVVDPALVLGESRRVVRSNGLVAVVFPPYYNLTGGSHLHGYATRFPGLNLVFSTKRLKSATARLFEEDAVEYRRFLRDVPSDRLWNMNGLTIHGFDELVRRLGFEPVFVRYRAHLEYASEQQRRSAGAARRAAYALAGFAARAPLLREVACMRVCALLRRPLDWSFSTILDDADGNAPDQQLG